MANLTIKRCFCCNDRLEAEEADGETIPIVYNATVWRSRGNFGSTIYDPMPNAHDTFLEMYICDNCLRKNKDFVCDITIIKGAKASSIVKIFDPKVLE